MTCHFSDIDEAFRHALTGIHENFARRTIEVAWPPEAAASNVMKRVSKGESSGTFWSQADTATLKTIS